MTPSTAIAKKEDHEINTLSDQHYESLVDELKSLFTERIFNLRIDKIKMMWDAGELIVDECEKHGVKNYVVIVKDLEEDIGISASQLYRAIKFKEKFGTWKNAMDSLPDGKNISWNKICEKVLPEIPIGKVTIKLPEMEMIDKFGICAWWEKQTEKDVTIILKDPKTSVSLRISRDGASGDMLQTPLQESLKIVREHYIKVKEWDPKNLDHTDYARIHASIKRLLLKARGAVDMITRAIDWVATQQYPDWSMETVEKKFADASKPENQYAKYLKKEKTWNRT